MPSLLSRLLPKHFTSRGYLYFTPRTASPLLVHHLVEKEKHKWINNDAPYIGFALATIGAMIHGFLFDDTDEDRYNCLASEDILHPPHYPWGYKESFITSMDAASIRRGFQVYREVCSSCHSLRFISYRHMKDVFHTEEELKAMAAEQEYEDGPDDNGEMFTRPGKFTDKLPKPYKNKEAARAANNGAEPPDLTNIIIGREGYEDYVFSLLTGYCDPPAGIQAKGTLNFNKYFPGNLIAMARNLYDGAVEYEDGTPATASQMAKDVVNFLAWCSDPHHDENQRMCLKAIVILSVMIGSMFYIKRFRWGYLNTKKIIYKPPPFRQD